MRRPRVPWLNRWRLYAQHAAHGTSRPFDGPDHLCHPVIRWDGTRAWKRPKLALLPSVASRQESNEVRELDCLRPRQVRSPRALPPRRDPRQLQYPFCTGFCHTAAPVGDAVSLPLDSQERARARHGRAVGASVFRARAEARCRGSGGKDSRVQADGAVLRGRRSRRTMSRRMRQRRRTSSRPPRISKHDDAF